MTVSELVSMLCSCSVCLKRYPAYASTPYIVRGPCLIVNGPCSRLDESLREYYTWKVELITVSSIFDDCLDVYIYPA